MEENPITLCSVCTGKFMPAPIVPRSSSKAKNALGQLTPVLPGEPVTVSGSMSLRNTAFRTSKTTMAWSPGFSWISSALHSK